MTTKLKRKKQRASDIHAALFTEASVKIFELRAERDRARAALLRIANSAALVLTSKQLPVFVRDGLEAIASEAREGAK